MKNLGVSEEIILEQTFESSDSVDIAPLKYKYQGFWKLNNVLGKMNQISISLKQP